jgi:NADPH2:quinone reductase
LKAAVVSHYGGPEVLTIRDMQTPTPLPKEILVRIQAIGLNFADIFGRFGVYPGTPKPPFIPGLEFAGDVVKIGAEVKRFQGGERVMGYCRQGSHAEFVAVDESFAVTLPLLMSYEIGASFLATYLSAYHGIIRLANLRRGEKLLVHAAAGGVGISTVQLAKHIGAEIFGTAGSAEKLSLARDQGADHVINYNEGDFAEEIRSLTNGYGVDVVMDSVGGEVYKKSWQLLAQMGRYILYGVSAVTGKGALSKIKAARVFSFMKPIFPQSLLHANKGLFGFNLGTLRGKENYFFEAVTELLKLYEQGTLRPLIGKIFPFDQIVEAHQYLQSRQSVGKVIVTLG